MKGKGSPLHKTLQQQLAQSARAAGLVAVIEADIQGKKIDVLVHTRTGLLAIEIHLNRHLELIADQLSKNARVGLRDQWVVVPDLWLKKVRTCLERQLGHAALAHVRVYSVSECSARNMNWNASNTAEQTDGTKSE